MLPEQRTCDHEFLTLCRSMFFLLEDNGSTRRGPEKIKNMTNGGQDKDKKRATGGQEEDSERKRRGQKNTTRAVWGTKTPTPRCQVSASFDYSSERTI